MKRILTLILVMSSFAVFSGTSSASIKPGASCSPKGKTSIFGGVKYTCVLSGKKLVWNKGIKVPVVVVQPTSNYVLLTDNSCNSNNAIAELQIYVGGAWIKKTQAAGFNLNKLCSVEGYVPWTIVDIPVGSSVRWRIYPSNNSWEYISSIQTVEKSYCSVLGNQINSVGINYECLKSGASQIWGIAPDPSLTFVPPVMSHLLSSTPCQLPYTGPYDGTITTGFPHSSDTLPTSGTINAIVVFEDFTDAKSTDDIAVRAKTLENALANFYNSDSYGKVNFNFTTYPNVIHVNELSSSFGMQNPGSGDLRALVKAEQLAASPFIDFSKYTMMYVVLPSTATQINDSLPIPLSYLNMMLPGNPLKFMVTLGPDSWKPQYWTIPLHETGHLFGLYHPWPNGEWDVVGVAGENSASFSAPGLLGWNKWLLNWVVDSQVACIDATTSVQSTYNYLISPLEVNTDSVKLVVIKIGPTKAIVIESRRSIGTDLFPKQYEGALIYLVDTSKDGDLNLNDSSVKLLVDTSYTGVGVDGNMYTTPVGTLRAGQSITYQGQTIKIQSNTSGGDYVQITTGTVTG